jgi:hypothetical protein
MRRNPTTLLRSAIRIVERERDVIVESHRIRSQKVMRTYRDLDASVRSTVRSMDRWLTAARRATA